MLGYVIPNRESNDTIADGLGNRKLSRTELNSYLLFFDEISYFSGVRRGGSFFSTGGEPFKMKLPDDPALKRPSAKLVLPFFTQNPQETVAEAMAIQMKEGFTNSPETAWVFHPRYFQTHAANRLCGEKVAPSVGITFLDGIYCPPDNVTIDEVLHFREQRSDERESFMQAIFEVSENLNVEDHRLILNVPITRVEKALAELNKTAIERWGDKVRRSFRWGIRPNQRTLASLTAALAAYEALDNFSLSVLIAIYGAIEFSVD